MNKLVKELKKAESDIKQGKCKTVSAEDFLKKYNNRLIKHRYNYKIKGWTFDWELLGFYNVKVGKDLYSGDNDTVAFIARKIIEDVMSSHNKKNHKILAKFIRQWLKRAIRYQDDYTDVWKGMLKIKYDENLISMATMLLGKMWT